MKALITGASSGIGRDMARYLNSLGIDLILVARDEEKLENLQKELKGNVKIYGYDLSVQQEVFDLYDMVKSKNIDILINNAGFGLFGEFSKTDLETELKMINLNVCAYHILTKLFLQDFIKKDAGYILNVCSSAGFMAGPRLSTYYSTKNYCLKLTMAIYEELRRMSSNVHISALCPGPVNTNFNKVAHGEFKIKGASSSYVAKYAIDSMFKNKLLIIPKISVKIGLFLQRFLPYKLDLKIIYNIQYRKEKNFNNKKRGKSVI